MAKGSRYSAGMGPYHKRQRRLDEMAEAEAARGARVSSHAASETLAALQRSEREGAQHKGRHAVRARKVAPSTCTWMVLLELLESGLRPFRSVDIA